MDRKLKKLLKVISNALVILVVVFAFLLHGTQFIGLKPYSVQSGSMQSVYPTGSLLYIRNVNPETLEVGDIITYKMTGGTLCTHRIIEFVVDENNPDITRFRTKGDENDTADGVLVEYDSVVGKAVFCIPFLGYIATYISVPPGKYFAITVAIAIIIIEIMISIVIDDKDKKKSQTKQN